MAMADLDKACDYWVSIYLRVFRMGWLNFPNDLEALPVEQKCGILRGMMVDAGKSGLLPSLEQVLDIIEKTGATAPPQQVAPAQEPPKTEAPKVAEAGQQKLAEAPESIPSPGTKPTAGGEPFATDKQVNAIRKFCETPRLKGVVAETLRTIGKGSAPQLSISEASDLIRKLYDMKGGIPPGAKVETGVKT
jgi:hypothetical protein